MNKDNPVQERLLDEFSPTTPEDWKAAAEKLLKGASFEKVMIRDTPEGIRLEPIFWREVLEDLPGVETFPGFDGYLRGTRAGGYRTRPWSIAQEIPLSLPSAFNRTLLDDLMGGQNAVSIQLDTSAGQAVDGCGVEPEAAGIYGLSLGGLEDLRTALRDVLPTGVVWDFRSGCAGLLTGSLFLGWLEEQQANAEEIEGCLGMDPLETLATTGTLPVGLEHLYDEAAELARSCQERAPRLRALGISTFPYHRAGASAVEELGIALASGVAVLEALIQRGLSVDEAAGQIRFLLHIGPHFFTEIAKFRVLRPLWARVVGAFGGGEEARKIRLHARTGFYNKTRLDPHVNIIRTTLESLSAVLAGVDLLTVGCYDALTRIPLPSSRRLARNTQIILQEECELMNTADPAGGSWAIESLTDSLGREAWAWFQSIEAEGGVVAALESGLIQERITSTATRQETLLHQRRRRLVGTNVYPQSGEKALSSGPPEGAKLQARGTETVAPRDREILQGLNELPELSGTARLDKTVSLFRAGATLGEMTQAFRKDAPAGPQVNPLPDRRLAVSYERLREACRGYAEERGSPPKVFLCCLGPLRKHKIRADFTRSFFEAGGFEVATSGGYESPEAAVTGVRESVAPVTVICGTDDDYTRFFPAFARAIREALPAIKILLAGHPGEQEATYREAGLDDFIFIKTNHYEFNARLLKELGVLNET